MIYRDAGQLELFGDGTDQPVKIETIQQKLRKNAMERQMAKIETKEPDFSDRKEAPLG
jgi:hypothetical protein